MQVLQAHVLPGTLTFTGIVAEVEANGPYTVESLQGYEWTFALALAGELLDAGNTTGNATGDAGEPYPVLLDNHNITESGFFEIMADIRESADWCAFLRARLQCTRHLS